MLLGIFDTLVSHADCYRYVCVEQCKEKLGSEGFSFWSITHNDYIILHHVIIKRLILWGEYALQHFVSIFCHTAPYMSALLALVCIL